jgi:hypothetical protein
VFYWLIVFQVTLWSI